MARSTLNLLLGFGTLALAFGLIAMMIWRRRRRALATLARWREIAARAGLTSVEGGLASGGPVLEGEYHGLAVGLRGEHGSNPTRGHTFLKIRLPGTPPLQLSLTALEGLGFPPGEAGGASTGDTEFDRLFVVAADASDAEVQAALTPAARARLIQAKDLLVHRSLQVGADSLEVLHTGIETDPDTLQGLLELLADLAPELAGQSTS